MRQKGQVLIFNDQELSLIKATFADNEDLLYAIRKVLLQLKLTDQEQKLIDSMSKEVYAVVKKRLYPDIDGDSPLTQIGDIYQTLTKDLQSKSVEDMKPLFDAKQLEIDYLNQQFNVLKGKKVEEKIKLSELGNLIGKDNYERFVHTTARNFLLGYIDPMLLMLKKIAGQKTESVDELKKRITRDSSK